MDALSPAMPIRYRAFIMPEMLGYEAPHHRARPQSTWGFASCICFGLTCGLFALALLLAAQEPGWGGLGLLALGFFAGSICSFVGSICGIIGMFDDRRSRTTAVIGLALNAIVVIAAVSRLWR